MSYHLSGRGDVDPATADAVAVMASQITTLKTISPAASGQGNVDPTVVIDSASAAAIADMTRKRLAQEAATAAGAGQSHTVPGPRAEVSPQDGVLTTTGVGPSPAQIAMMQAQAAPLSKLPSWALPVGAAVGGLILLKVLKVI